MKKTAQRNAHTTEATQAASSAAVQDMSPETATVIASETATILTLEPGKGQRKSLMASVASENAQNALRKVQALQIAKQHLAEASDLYNEGSDKSQEATGVASKAALTLYQGRADGVLSDDEINAALCDVFGRKPKQDGTPGRTPAGQGEGIRKRVVRAVKAWEYVTDGDGGSFFNDLPTQEVQDVLDNIEEVGLFGAYERFAKVRKDHMTRVEPAYDPKRIAGLADALSNDIAMSAEMFATNPALLAAYTALVEVIGQCDTAAANYAEAEAA
jgi:hypothetical protein